MNFTEFKKKLIDQSFIQNMNYNDKYFFINNINNNISFNNLCGYFNKYNFNDFEKELVNIYNFNVNNYSDNIIINIDL